MEKLEEKSSEIIEINCRGSDTIDWHKVEDVQKSVKTMSVQNMEKLLTSLKVYGFNEPICVWKDVNNPNRHICLAGNQRLKALKKAEELGWSVPSKVPCNFIEAKDEKQAKLILLSLASTLGK